MAVPLVMPCDEWFQPGGKTNADPHSQGMGGFPFGVAFYDGGLWSEFVGLRYIKSLSLSL